MIKKLLLLILVCLLPLSLEAKRWNSSTEFQCMVANLYFEARGEGYEGMKAVAAVTVNRMKSGKYPRTLCGVIFQRKQFSWTHQKSWSSIQKIMTGSIKLSGKDAKAYQNAVIIAAEATRKTFSVDKLQDSLFYHAYYVHPRWTRKMQKVAIVGSHIFYKG